jgi:hypothetical protein
MKKGSKADVIKYLETTPVISVVCQKAGIARATYYRWYREKEKFREEADKAIKCGINFVNDLAESQLISVINKGNITAIIYWLKNHHKDYAENKLYLSNNDQEKITGFLESSDIKAICVFTLERFYKGEITKSAGLSLISMIKKIHPKLTETSVDMEIKETIRKLRESDEKFRQLIKINQQDPKALPLMT